MAYDLPRLADLSQRFRRLFSETIPGAVVDVWPSTFYVFSKVLAAGAFEIHLRLAFLYRQLFASTADEVWLDRHGFELGLTRVPASKASGFATITCTAGVVIPSGLTFSRSDGALFVTRTSGLGAGGATEIELQAVEVGLAGNSLAGETMTLVDTGVVAGLGSVATVGADGIGGGSEIEAVEAFRQRILDRKRSPPQGGSATDWIAWAKAADGAVSRVFVDSFVNDTRVVWLSFLRSDRMNGIPTAPDVAEVQAYVEDPVRRPVTARVYVIAPVPQAVNITIGSLAPLSVAVQEAVLVELQAMFAERAQPATPSAPSVFFRSWIQEAISRAAGEDSHTLTAPAGNVTYSTAGHMPVLGTVSYT